MSSPIFIHSLFRAGSTYIFKVFRRSPAGYWCYQEPVHDAVLMSKDNPSELLNYTSSRIKEQLHHPDIGNSYFYELYEVYEVWKGLLSKEIIYDTYFDKGDSKGLIKYLFALITAAKGRPVTQECRTSHRIVPIKRHLEGTHIYLWRNPWDQWWSYKTTDYFESVNQVILNSNTIPDVIHRLRLEIGFSPYRSDDIYDEITHYNSRRMAPEESFMVFYTLWCLSLLEGIEHSDIVMNIDALSNQAVYRQEILRNLELRGISDITLDDCQVTQTYYTEKDKEFFRKVEDRVHGLLLISGYPQRVIDQITGLRQEFEPAIWKLPLEEIPSELLVENALRARDQVKRIEQRESVQLTQAEATITDAKAKEYEANVRAEQTQVRAEQAEVQTREAIIRAEQAEVRAREAINRAARAEAQASELTNKTAYLSTALHEVYESDSWKITHPLRLLGSFARWFYHGSVAWLTFAPNSRPRRVARNALLLLRPKINANLPIQDLPPVKESISTNVSSLETPLSEDEKYFLDLFQRELTRRQGDKKGFPANRR